MEYGTKVVELLEEAERVALESIAAVPRSAESPDYAELGIRLDLAHRIANLKNDAKKVYGIATMKRGKRLVERILEESESATVVKMTVEAESDSDALKKEMARRTSERFGLPAYFVDDDRLLKFAASKKGPFKMYRRIVPLSNVDMVIDGIFELVRAKSSFSIKEVEERVEGLPNYKVRATVSALAKCGILMRLGAGVYRPSSVFAMKKPVWLNALRELPVRYDLVEEYEKM